MTDAGRLPPRVAQVVSALLDAAEDLLWLHGDTVTTSGVRSYDTCSSGTDDTAAALARARKLGLAEGGNGRWYPTHAARAIRRELEDLAAGEAPRA
jgi:hypothetical protein